MAFKTDGSVHYSGIANEQQTARILNEINHFDDKVVPIGGTKHKEDAVAGNIKLSIKDKKKLSTGSFDWVNTSIINHIFNTHFDSFKEKVKEIRSEDCVVRKTFVDPIRAEFASLCSDGFNHLSKNQVCDLIVQSVSHGIDFVFVNDQENKILYKFNPEDHPVVDIAKTCDSIRFHTSRNAKASRKIIFVKNGVEYYYGIRLRITCNNGINAFLSLSKSNKNSQVVLKLKQDSVHKLVKEHIECTTISYG